MTDSELIRRAENAGIATSYVNWQRELVEVPAETLAAILDGLGDGAVGVTSGGGETPDGQTGRGAAAARGVVAAESGRDVSGVAGQSGRGANGMAADSGPGASGAAAESGRGANGAAGQSGRGANGMAAESGRGATQPANWPGSRGRQWGFTVQLYSLRSRDSWGHGDLHDLAELARWSGSEHGAGFVLINPLHAVEPQPPISASPYLPMTRLFTSPLYLRVEDIPEYEMLSAAERDAIQMLAAPLKQANTTADLIDRDQVWIAKRAALELIYNVLLAPQRQEAFAKFRAERQPHLDLWATWCALAERHGADSRRWPVGGWAAYGPPPDLTDTAQAQHAVQGDPQLKRAAEFHAWLQWHLDEQLQAAQRAAKEAGMAHGIIHDLAVGVHPGGADAWAHPELLVPGFSIGAPPDGFNQLGQDWGAPPWHPRNLAAAGYQPMADLFSAALRHSGGLRVDHVMGLMRLWWVPAGMRPDQGAYVRFDHRASVAALSSAAAKADAVAIGEDLGTVDRWIREYLAGHGVLGTMMLWFAHDSSGAPLPPSGWRRGCMATVGTHDVAPASGFITGDQVTVRARLGLLKTSEERERGESQAALARWQAALQAEGLLSPGQGPSPAEFTVALYGYLRKTPCLLIGVSLADAVGEVRTQNIPGTNDEYPNWRIPLCDAQQRPVLLEELPGIRLVRDVCQAVRS